MTPDTALRLALFFGNEAAFWMHLQVAWDMHVAMRELRAARRAEHSGRADSPDGLRSLHRRAR